MVCQSYPAWNLTSNSVESCCHSPSPYWRPELWVLQTVGSRFCSGRPQCEGFNQKWVYERTRRKVVFCVFFFIPWEYLSIILREILLRYPGHWFDVKQWSLCPFNSLPVLHTTLEYISLPSNAIVFSVFKAMESDCLHIASFLCSWPCRRKIYTAKMA